jgi:hypothetical protein
LKPTRKSKKAVSSMVGAVFFVIIIVFGLNLLTYNLAMHDQLAASLAARESSTFDKRAEALRFLDLTINGTTSKLNITVFNSGSRTIHISRIVITNESSPTLWHRVFLVSYWINVAEIFKGMGSTLGNFAATSTFTIGLLTDRGNTFAGRYKQSNLIVPTVQGTGSLTMDYASYVYTVYVNSPNQIFGPFQAWCIVNSTTGKRTVQFETTVINHGDRDFRLLKLSYLVIYQPSGSAQPFYIMDSSSTPKLAVAYGTKIVLPANVFDQQAGGPPVTTKFLASSPGGTSQANNALSTGVYPVFAVFYYEDLFGNTYSQTIPFEASVITAGASC